MFMTYDHLMYDDRSTDDPNDEDMPMRAQASNLNEQLGMVEYVFSDKTGTLTCNIMEFRKFTAGMRSYGLSERPTEKQESNVCFYDPAFNQCLSGSDGKPQDKAALERCLLFLSLCHTIVIDKATKAYNAASPDELALVNFAKQMGYVYEDIDENDCMVVKINGQPQKYKLLHVCEFSSARKRMSVIVEEEGSGKVLLFCKGADSFIYERLSQESKDSPEMKSTQQSVDSYAREGLRTLFLAEREIPKDEFNAFFEKAKAAKLLTKGREEALEKVDEEIEVGLKLVGSTAIEDRLQDEVADTIRFMKRTGIKVWVLTGDKIETAINIGFSAGLLDTEMEQHLVDGESENELNNQLVLAKQRVEANLTA